MVEALTLQKSGNSTPCCSKTVSPVFQLVWTTSRRSQVTSSYGCTPLLKTRLSVSPAPLRPFFTPFFVSPRPLAERVVSDMCPSFLNVHPVLWVERSALGW